MISGLIQRCLAVLAFICTLAILALATPVHPEMRELLKQPDSGRRHAPAARAGWNGPEMAVANDVEGIGGVSAAQAEREARESLRQSATPDWATVLGVAAVILLLRMLRKRNDQALAEATPVTPTDSNSVPNAMRPAA
jgi:hypothetical protein